MIFVGRDTRGGVGHLVLIVAAVIPAHRVGDAAIRISERGAEHTAAAPEADVDEVGQARCARCARAVHVHLEQDVAAGAGRTVVRLDAAHRLPVGDVDGDLRHHKVHRIAVHEARKTRGAVHTVAIADLRKPASVTLAVSVAVHTVHKGVVHDVVGRVVDGARIPHDCDVVVGHCGIDHFHPCRGGQPVGEELCIERASGADLRAVRAVHRRLLGADVAHLDIEVIHGHPAGGGEDAAARQSVRLEE